MAFVDRSFRARLAIIAWALILVVAACSSPSATTAPPATAATPPLPPSSSPAPASAPASPSDATGFAFDAESVTAYYRSQGYLCTGPAPSALAQGYAATSCQLTDPAGRRRTVGVVIDPNDELADAFASVSGTATESILDPSVAIEPLGGFLGATLGSDRGAATLPWLAAHLGDAFAETTVDDLRLATYLKDEDHSTLYVELANAGYLEAPRPSASP
jgi:hypothetical protein